MPINFIIVLFILLAACTHTPLKPLEPSVISTWTELAPGNKLLARAIISDASDCPVAHVTEGSTVRDMKMSPRGQKNTAFPHLTCELAVAPGAERIVVAERELPALKRDVTKILVLGDTGCRVKKDKAGFANQGCLDPEKWPFAEVAKSAAGTHPDLVIHVGDYHYREADCPAGEASCQSVVSGDNWESWRQDFFAPADPLLQSAPWLLVRGNHEDCERAGLGWNLTLSAQEYSNECSRGEAPFAFEIGDHLLAVADSAYEANIAPSLETLAKTAPKKKWLLLHRPILTRSAEIEAAKTPLPKTGATLILAGHVHTLSLNRFTDGRPPEFIVGNGGANLDVEGKLGFLESPLLMKTAYRDYGFVILQRQPASSKDKTEWRGVVHDKNGKAVFSCQIVESLKGKTRVDCDR